jgi:hypothetical protein
VTQSTTAFEQKVAYTSTLSIAEVDEQNAPAGRAVILVGPSLPFMGSEWGFENNLVTTWYPGNAIEGTQQNLGPRELPSSWEGEWKRTLMGRTPAKFQDASGDEQQIISPHVLREIVEDIGRTGKRLLVIWSVSGDEGIGPLTNQESRPTDMRIIRVGRMKTFKTPIDRHTDIRWTMEFHWVSRGQKQNKAGPSTREDQDATTIANGIQTSIRAFENATIAKAIIASNKLIPRSASKLTLGQLESLANLPTTIVNSSLRSLQVQENNFKRLADIALTAASQGNQVMGAVGNFARNSRAIAHQTYDSLTRIPIELTSTKDTVDAALRGDLYFNPLKDASIVISKQATDVVEKVSQQAVALGLQGKATIRESSTTKAGQITGVHLAKTGDTPQSVSTKYFKTPDRAADILRANKMPLHTPSFTPGQILVIPAPATTQQGRP